MPNEFKVWVGIAVEDRQIKSREIKVFLREMTPYSAGKIEDTTKDETYTVSSDDGSKVSGSVSTTNNVVADYFGANTNSAFPPDIVKGEQVIVLKYADEDKYYWMSAGRDDNLRRGELVRWAISDDQAVKKDLTESNTYFMEMDTKIEKRIRIHTSKSDGESYGYDVIIDAKNHFVKISDDVGNRIELESDNSRVKVTNAAGATVDLDKSDINIIAPQHMNLRAGGYLILSAPSVIINGASIQSGGITKVSGP